MQDTWPAQCDPKTWHHGQHTKSASETTSQTLLAHQIPARNSVASRMENVCGSSVEMIANDAETYRNHELENRKSRIAPWAEDRRSLEIFGSNLDLIKETGNMWKHAQISPMTKPKSATARQHPRGQLIDSTARSSGRPSCNFCKGNRSMPSTDSTDVIRPGTRHGCGSARRKSQRG
jgi:hypothetical protein